MKPHVLESVGWALGAVWFVLGFVVGFVLDLTFTEAAIVYVYAIVGVSAAALVFYATGLKRGRAGVNREPAAGERS